MQIIFLSLHPFDEAVLVESVGQVALITQHQHRDAGQLLLLQQTVKFIPGRLDLVRIRGVDHVSNHESLPIDYL